MPESDVLLLSSQIKVKINGTELPRDVMTNLQFAQVDQHVMLPGMFILRFIDQELKLTDGDKFELGKSVEISSADPSQNGTQVVLIKGEITAIEPEYAEGMIAELVVRGYDKSHRLFRESKSKSWINTKDSDIATSVAGSAGLSPQVEATTEVFKHIFQHNQTDMEFLMQRAWRVGYECFVQDGKLFFRKPPASGTGATLTWGQELLSFHPRLSLAEQVNEVKVQGWDPSQKKEIIGKASSSSTNPQIGLGKWGGQAAQSAFGAGKMILVDHTVVSQADADKLAQARLDEINGAFIEAEGECFRSPEITAGKFVELKGLGRRFSGKYLITNAQHTFTVTRGFLTSFQVRGTRTGMLAEQVMHQPPADRWPAAVPAIVTNNTDPEKLGRVKVKFPWLDVTQESNWARISSLGAGKERGIIFIPEVDDEVLVTFMFGDFDYPVVLGGLWNPKDKMPLTGEGAVKSGKVEKRTIQTRVGHRIIFHDDDSEPKIEIITKDDRSITLTDKSGSGAIELKTKQSSIKLTDDKLEIKTQSDTSVNSSGGKVSVEGAQDVTVKGMNVNVQAQGNMTLKANGNLDVQASGVVNIKGSMVNLN